MTKTHQDTLSAAAEAVAEAEALVIGAGAGIGVDSGLPDFRGRQGFWHAYPPYSKLGLDFIALANPRWFHEDPELAWGFYGHRMKLYREAKPHPGFAILKRWGESKPHGAFVYTSNIDGQFQRAGFDPDRIVELHGALDALQCRADCGVGTFPAHGYSVEVDKETMRAAGELPRCPSCGDLARPNILMFDDWGFDDRRTAAQSQRFLQWVDSVSGSKVVIVECGAGTTIPTVRIGCEELAERLGAVLVRVNPRDTNVPPGQFSIHLGALAGLEAIDGLINPS